MKPESPLITANALVADVAGVYSNPDCVEADFGYSDGSEAERYLFDVLQRSEDLSSDSETLHLAIKDWPSEYHLSSKRANLLRPLPLEPGSRVLELGCGCGAITRYLGETGFNVDAIEGSAIRARLAAMRCRDLETVTIVEANFNLLTLPDGEYDYVLLVGVAEYARRFTPNGDSDRGALIDLLGRVKQSLAPGGQVLVAIENRTGMKYLHGAFEDHYSKRFVGIDNYPDSAGIRTYSRREWHGIADDGGFDHHTFLYPFPDYKIPTVYLGDDFIYRDDNAWCHLEGIDSTDYTFLFDPAIPESLTWQGYNAAGVLADLSNSFLVVLGTADNLEAYNDIDFVHLPDFRRKRHLCTIISKLRGSSVVRRSALRSDNGNDASSSHRLGSEPYIEGTLLSSRWVRTIMTESSLDDFNQHIIQYVDFLEAQALQGPLPMDLLPNNIIVDAAGDFRIFDQEWQTDDSTDIDYLLFRAALTFANNHRVALRQFARRFDTYDVGEFIRHCLTMGRRGNRLPEEFCQLEDDFQNRILLQRDIDTRSVLATPLVESPVRAMVNPRIKLTLGDGDACVIVSTEPLTPGRDWTTLTFKPDLPDSTDDKATNNDISIDTLTFQPCDANRPLDTGFFNIDSIKVMTTHNGSESVLWSLEGEEIIIAKTKFDGINYLIAGDERLLAVAGDRPSMHFQPSIRIDSIATRTLRVDIHIRFNASREYRLALSDFLVKEQAFGQRIKALESELDRRSTVIERLTSEIESIKSSTTWRTLSAIRKKISAKH